MRVEHSDAIKSMSDEQLEAAIEAIQGMIAARDAGRSQGDRSGGRVAIAWRVGGSDTSPDAVQGDAGHGRLARRTARL